MKTTIRWWVWILVLLQAASRTGSAHETPAAPATLQLEIAFEGTLMPPRCEAEAMREASLIWARYGVTMRTSGTRDIESRTAVRLPVTFVDRHAQAWTTEPLGSITFVGETPEPAIAIYPNAIAALVSTVDFAGRGPDAWPLLFRDVTLGRVVGRALAHEIGHFLLRTTRHSRSGLMRALQPARELVDPDRRGFVLSTEEEMRLGDGARFARRPLKDIRGYRPTRR